MPIYDYKCPSCNHRQEKKLSMQHTSPIICPECQKQNMIKVPCCIGIHFKGSGFYETDYKGK